MTIETLARITESNGLILSGEQLKKLSNYAELLRAQNQIVNLISRKDEENIFSKHIIHSLTLLLPSIPLAGIPQSANVFDLGTGGGLPGIPIKIVRNDISLTFCDSITKKINAVREMTNALQLTNCFAIAERAEDFAKKRQYRNRYEVIITRAVAPLDELMVWSFNLLKKGGSLLALKGGDISQETERTKRIKHIAEVSVCPLLLNEFNDFLNDEKKLVRVTIN